MSPGWFKNVEAIDCDLVLEATGQALGTIQLPVVPRVGDELELDRGERAGVLPLYRVVRVRYHVRPRPIAMRDLFGVSLFVEPAG